MIFWVALFDRKDWHGHSEIAIFLMNIYYQIQRVINY